MSLSPFSLSFNRSVNGVLTTINSVLGDDVAGCSKPFAVRIIRQAVGQFDTLQNAFHSELVDHVNMQRSGDQPVVLCKSNVDALERLRALLECYRATATKCDYIDHQLTTLAEYVVFG